MYSIWRGSECVYIGMSGRASTAESLAADVTAGKKRGLVTRLAAHRSGIRSGDQFCVYVGDRLVLPTLSHEQIISIAAATLSMDSVIRDFIRAHLAYRVVVTPDGPAALALERRLLLEGLDGHLPLLNARPAEPRRPA